MAYAVHSLRVQTCMPSMPRGSPMPIEIQLSHLIQSDRIIDIRATEFRNERTLEGHRLESLCLL